MILAHGKCVTLRSMIAKCQAIWMSLPNLLDFSPNPSEFMSKPFGFHVQSCGVSFLNLLDFTSKTLGFHVQIRLSPFGVLQTTKLAGASFSNGGLHAPYQARVWPESEVPCIFLESFGVGAWAFQSIDRSVSGARHTLP